MKIVKGYPPNYEAICEHFDIKGNLDVIFTYGSDLYDPKGEEHADHIMVHEETHEQQQLAMGIEVWWNRYLVDMEFRLAEEIEAYRNQYRFVEAHYGRAQRRFLLNHMAKSLASSVYGNMILFEEALQLIQKV